MMTSSISPDLSLLVIPPDILSRYAVGFLEGRMSTASTVGDEDRPLMMNRPLHSVVLLVDPFPNVVKADRSIDPATISIPSS
jgi:hypothetical protein